MNIVRMFSRTSMIVLVLMCFCIGAFAQWNPQTVPPGISLLISVDFSSSQRGTACGYINDVTSTGRAVYTTNGGTLWTLAQVPDSARSLVSVQMFDNGVGYIAGAHNSSLELRGVPGARPAPDRNNPVALARAEYLHRIGLDGGDNYRGLFLRSTDDGQSWSTWGALPESTYYLMGISFISPALGFVTSSATYQVGRAGILKTTNGGMGWTAATISDSIVSLPSIQFTNASQGFAAGYRNLSGATSGVILRTTNSGTSWEQHDFPQVDNFTGVSAVDASIAYVSGVTPLGDAVVYKTTDAGTQWLPLPLSSGMIFPAGICFAKNSPTGMVYGVKDVQGQTLPYAARTTDGGSNWTQATLPGIQTNSLLAGGTLLDENLGYLVGGFPAGLASILHTANGGVTYASEEDGETPHQFMLSQNYPNPFNPTTTIDFSLAMQSHVTLKIYNLLGQLVKTLIDDVREAGQSSVGWNSMDNSGRPVGSGVYFYRLQADHFAETKTLLLIR